MRTNEVPVINMLYDTHPFIIYDPMIFYFITNITYDDMLLKGIPDEEISYLNAITEWVAYTKSTIVEEGMLPPGTQMDKELWERVDLRGHLPVFLDRINIDNILDNDEFFYEHLNKSMVIMHPVWYGLLGIQRVMDGIGAKETVYFKYADDKELAILNLYRDNRFRAILNEDEIIGEYHHIPITINRRNIENGK